MFKKKKEEKQEKQEKQKKQKKTDKKNKKSEKYVELKGLFGNAKDYHVYHMQKADFIVSGGIGFLAAAVVLYAFFNSMLIVLIGGAICAKMLPKYYQEYRQKKQLNELRMQFKDLLDSLTASYSAGLNTVDSFVNSLNDMISIYGEDADIVDEVKNICVGLKNNINIEALLIDFAERSGLDDVMSFANVFEVCNRQGGDLKRIVVETREIINDKIEVEMEIETMIAGSKNELNIMMVMPVIIVVMMKGLGSETVGGNTLGSILVKVICLGIFVLAYMIGRKIIEIKI